MPDLTHSEQAATDLLNAANRMDFNADEFVAIVLREHRTIQQTLGGAVFKLIEAWGLCHVNGDFDLRNEDTTRQCHEIMEGNGYVSFTTKYI